MSTWYTYKVNPNDGGVSITTFEAPTNERPKVNFPLWPSAREAWVEAQAYCASQVRQHGREVKRLTEELQAANTKAAKATLVMAVVMDGFRDWEDAHRSVGLLPSSSSEE